MGSATVKKGAAGTAVILAMCSIFVKITAFARDIVLSYVYGAGTVSDAYLVAAAIPTVLFTGVLTSLYTSYIVMFYDVRAKGEHEVNKYTSNLINVISIAAVLFILVFWIFKEQFVYLFASGFAEEAFALTAGLSRISIISIIFMGISYVFQGYLQANNRFYLVALFMVPVNIMIALGIVFSAQGQNYIVMSGAIVLAYAAVVPIFWIQAARRGFRFVPYLNFRDAYLIETMRVVLPIFAGQMLAEINNIVDKNMASRLPAGYVTSLDYGFKVATMVHSVLAWPIATMIFPKLSQYLSEGKVEESKGSIRKSLTLMSMVIIPVVLMVAVLAEPIIELLFYRGAFREENVIITAQALKVYVISSIPIAYRIIFEKAFYAMKDTKRPIIFSAFGIAINILLDILLLKRFAHVGLAFATVVSCTVTTLLYMIWMTKKKMTGLFDKTFWLVMLRTVIAAAVMTTVVREMKQRLYTGVTGELAQVFVKLILIGLAGLGAYVLSWAALSCMRRRGEKKC